MSYCRWSSDDYQCDVYVWEDVAGGFRTEVAARRFIFDVPLPEPVDLPDKFTHEQFLAWHSRHNTVGNMHGDETAGHWLNLPDPEGGRSFWHKTAGECADNLERLRAAGFNVPQYAVDGLRAVGSSTAEADHG